MIVRRYRLYIDESGDHSYKQLGDSSKRYLGLTACLIEAETYRTRFQPALEALKQRHFPHSPDEPVILHRTDIINKRGPFWRLRDLAREEAFNKDLLKSLDEHDYLIITVVIDKMSHINRYGAAAHHPYNYCLAVLMERYCGFLNRFNAEGDVMAESRGGRENRELEATYQQVYQKGTRFRNVDFFQRSLTSKEMKLKPKKANVAGLQLADLLAYPCKQGLLMEHGRIGTPKGIFGDEIRRCVEAKYNHRYGDGKVEGYGKIFLE